MMQADLHHRTSHCVDSSIGLSIYCTHCVVRISVEHILCHLHTTSAAGLSYAPAEPHDPGVRGRLVLMRLRDSGEACEVDEG